LSCEARSITRPTILGQVVNTVSHNKARREGNTIRHSHKEDHEDTPLLPFVCQPAGSDAEEASSDIRGHSHELSQLWVGVAEILDDGGEKERVRVQASVDTDGDEHVHPDLPVLEGGIEVLAAHLVGKGGSVLLKTAHNFLTFGLCEKFGSSWVIMHGPQSNNGYGMIVSTAVPAIHNR
jgi:hypothetical protein